MFFNGKAEFDQTKTNFYLRELGKTIKKEYGKHAHFELILVGGAAIACQYEFRERTMDLDAMSTGSIKEAINKITDKYNLPNDWLNTDFQQTESYSPKLRQYAKYYGTFSNVLEVRMIHDEYLIAMKLKSFRPYKHDRSDIVGITAAMQKEHVPDIYQKVQKAVEDLYGNIRAVNDQAWDFFRRISQQKDLSNTYTETVKIESTAKEAVLSAAVRVNEHVLEKYANDIAIQAIGKDAFINAIEDSIDREHSGIHELDDNGNLIDENGNRLYNDAPNIDSPIVQDPDIFDEHEELS